MFDMDNDGWNDLLVCNGVNRDVTNLDFMDFFANDVIQRMVMTGKKDDIDKVLKEIPQTPLPNKIYRNERNLKFTAIEKGWGLAQPCFSNGAAYGDLDNDGDLDLVINNENQPSFIYRNNARELNKNNYISLNLKGKGGNPFAIGAKVQLFAGTEIQTREHVPSRGFQSSVDYKLVFGLGNTTSIDSMIITWPDRSITRVMKPAINKDYLVSQEGTQPPMIISPGKTDSLFSFVANPFDRHQEDDYVDFYNERGIPRILSREGPKAATADINGDGLMDIYIGGASGHPGQLYIQTPGGKYIKKEEKAFAQFFSFEDDAVLFFDSDKDGDMDLLLCPGGNNQPPVTPEMQIRLFRNDGKGNFTIDTKSFPWAGMNISVAVDHDFTGDGYPDLFLGGRNYPNEYGINPHSFLFVNDGTGHFNDIAPKRNPDIAEIGMVTGAAWADMTDDPGKELVITGEWMAPRIFSFKKDHFVEIETTINHLFGWWQTMSIADLNGDGRQDIALGNVGENFYLRPNEKEPVKLWVSDFDHNDHKNKIITYTVNGKDMPVFLKNDLQEQLPSIKNQNLKHKQFAESSIQDLFASDIISSSMVKEFTYASSCIAFNEGGGKFRIEKLPVMSQLSCINSILISDVNNDGKPDLVTGGNQFGFLPQFEKLDGNFGEVLINQGNGVFNWQEPTHTGLNIQGEVKDILDLQENDKRYFLFLRNNDYPVLYLLKK